MMNGSYDTDAYQEWFESLGDIQKAECRMLDAYMQSRDNLPGKTVTGENLVLDPKTTTEIQDDLQDMMFTDAMTVYTYMVKHGFGFTTADDGTVKWAIWRDMKPLM